MKASPPRFVPVVAALLLAVAVPAIAAPAYDIVLSSRTFVPAQELRGNPENAHVVIQFYDIPSQSEREELAARGIVLFEYIPNYAWTASAKAGALSTLDASKVRSVFTLAPGDKISRRTAGQHVVRAFVYPDVPDGAAREVLAKYGSVMEATRNVYTLELSGDIKELAAEDVVKYVDGPLPEKVESLDDLRANIHADEVQTSPYDLHGTGIYAGIWDNGSVCTDHPDFSGRLVVGDGSSTGSHPTACGGILAGDGSRSEAYGGTPYQWRGIADDCYLASYSWPDDVPNMDSETTQAINLYDIVVSSNSWSWGLCPDYCEYYGDYDDWSQNYDKIVAGSLGKRISVVFAAGNDGDCTDCSADIPDFPYGTVPGPGSTAKNTIVVGSNNADTDGLSWYSSMGPTLDGRLKPDIVAPGCKSSAGVTTTAVGDGYTSSSCGTSYSCPVVSGCVVLTQEDYIDKFGDAAWPSTVKALIIQGAEDLGNVGPDYQFGFGRVNIQNTIDIVRADGGTGDLIKEDSITTGQTWTYDVEVDGESELKVTLAWDDYFGSYEGTGKKLINDLDLELISPSASTYHPWVLDPDNPSYPATTGVDDLNNVEQVVVNSPANGTWTIRVVATLLPQPDQDFSLVTNCGPAAADPPPADPTGLGAFPGSGEGEIDVDWNDNNEPDFDHYRLERADNPSFTGASSFTVSSSDYADSGLTPGDTYYYRVYAVDAGGNESGASGSDSAVATDLPPATPTGLVATPGPGEGEIEVSWDASTEPDFDHYRLERDTDDGFGPGSDPFEGQVAYHADSGLVPGDEYFYRVFAIDAGGNESPPSTVVSAIALNLAPATPTGLVATPGPGEGEIEVSWDANTEPDFDHYRLERDTDDGFGPGSDPFEGQVAYHADSGLLPGEEYFYRVFAVDAGGNESLPSTVVSAIALDLAPSTPTGLTAVAGAGEGQIDVDWSDSVEGDFDHYRLERAANPGFAGASSFTVGASEYADSGLTPGATYYYRVYAVDTNSNESGASDPSSAVATDLAPAAPTGLVAEGGTLDDEILISWDANLELDLDHYRLERDTTSVFGAGTVAFETSDESYLDAGLPLGATYFYRLFAIDAGGNESASSDTVDHTLIDTDVPDDLAASVSFMRPNPFTQESAIAYAVPAQGARVSLRIYDINGRLVRTLVDAQVGGGLYEAVWDGRDARGAPVSSGIYFCRAEVDTVTEVRKVVLIR